MTANDNHQVAPSDETGETGRVGVFRDRAAYLRWHALPPDAVLLVSPIGDPAPLRMPPDARMLIVDAVDLDADGTVALFAGHWQASFEPQPGRHLAVRLNPPRDPGSDGTEVADVVLHEVLNNEIWCQLVTWLSLDASWPEIVAPVAAAAFARIIHAETADPDDVDDVPDAHPALDPAR